MPDENNDTQKRIADKEQKNVFDSIHQQLVMLNQSQKKVSDSLKKQQVQDLKEKTQEPAEPQKEMQEVLAADDEKQMSALRKTFEKSFGSIKESFSPGGLLKGFGLLSGSPIFMLLGDKFDDLIGQYGEFRKENKEAAALQEEANQESFMQEDIRDKELELAEKQNEILEDIRDKPSGVEDKKGGLSGILGGIAGIFSTILPKSLGKLLPKILGKGLFKGAGKGLGKGLKILKGGAKILGKLALPLAAIISAFDFFKGFKSGEEITGRKGLAAKIQGGFANVISGLTFGLVDPAVISQGIDTIMEKLKSFFMAPIEMIQGFFSSEAFQEKFSSVSQFITSAFETIFVKPFEFLKGLFNLDNIKEKIATFTTAIKEKIDSFIQIIVSPFETIKGIFSKIGSALGIKKQSSGFMNEFGGDDDPFATVSTTKRQNSSLDNIATTIVEQRKASEINEARKREIARDKQTNNSIIQSTQNNVVMQEDLSTKIDDKNFITDSWF